MVSAVVERKTAFSKAISDYCDKFEKLSVDELIQNTENAVPYWKKCVELMQEFEAAYTQKKEDEAAFDFNDLEKYALKVLENEQILEEVRAKYQWIFVDEYQDVNETQEKILSLLKGKDNLFLVGDIKQSIYGFRQCDPEIFAEKLQEEKTDASALTLSLRGNFRSDKTILDFVNVIFSQVMTEPFGKVSYRETSLLETAGERENPVELCFIPKETQQTEAPNEVYDVRNPSDAAEKDPVYEARLIAEKIRVLLREGILEGGHRRSVSYGDIAILCRVRNEYTTALYEELLRCRIPVVAETRKNLFDCAEIDGILRFLRLIDNPNDDVSLYGSLKTFARLTDAEISEIRLAYREDPFFLAAEKYATTKTPVAERMRNFFDLLERYRFYAQSFDVDELVSRLIAETDYELYCLGLPEGGVRKNRLHLFRGILKDKSFNGSVAAFLKYVDSVGSAEGNISAEGHTDAVTLLSIHSSKGLEYPVVFLCGTGRKFRYSTDPVLLHKTLGIGMQYYSPDHVIHPTLSYAAVKYAVHRKEREEELRILYVALTRAKQKLFVVGCVSPSLPKKAWMLVPSQCDRFAEWIFYGIAHDEEEEMPYYLTMESIPSEEMPPEEPEIKFTRVDKAEIARYRELWDTPYPDAARTMHPKKVVSSGLKAEDLFEETPPETPLYPSEKGISPELGTAYHKVLEKMNFFSDDPAEAEKTIAACLENKDFTPKVAAEVQTEKLNALKNHPKLQAYRGWNVYKELPFMLNVKRSDLFAEHTEETVILQGVIDLLFTDGKEACVFDYKITAQPEGLRERYAPQLRSYALAVNRILNLPCKMFLIDVLHGKIEEISDV